MYLNTKCITQTHLNNNKHLVTDTPSPACSLVKYSGWEEIRSADLGVWAQLDLAPVFITRMRSVQSYYRSRWTDDETLINTPAVANPKTKSPGHGESLSINTVIIDDK